MSEAQHRNDNNNTQAAPRLQCQDLDRQYLGLLRNIRDNGTLTPTRTQFKARTIPGALITHNMEQGFPLLNCRPVPYKSVRVELEGFLKGIQSKKWYQDRGCKIWNEWCNPEKVNYGHDPDTKMRMELEDDLGRIYGVQWRDFGAAGFNTIDQLKSVVDTLRRDPLSRRNICSAWNPLDLPRMALPPCHVLWRVSVDGNSRLNLSWYQRSVDVPRGLPFNIASYATLLLILVETLDCAYTPGALTGFLDDVHYYENQEPAVLQLLEREQEAGTIPLPRVRVKRDGVTAFDWSHEDFELEPESYRPIRPGVDFGDIAV